jgi:predicted DsbA family dithiol-disulfide isomerase
MPDSDRFHLLVVSDYVCPWCYIGAARVDQMQAEFDIDVTWWPYELHPDTPKEGRQLSTIVRREGRGPGFAEYLRENLQDAGRTMVERTLVSNSHIALEAAEFARDSDQFDPMHRALLRAYFEEGKDIGDLDVVVDIGGSAGLNRAALRDALEQGRYRQVIDEARQIAREQGITSTPTFVLDERLTIPGAQEYLVFQDALRRLGAPRRQSTAHAE